MNNLIIKTENEANIRQKIAFKNILENNGKLQPALEQAGYSKGYAKNPQLIKKNEGMEISDENLFT